MVDGIGVHRADERNVIDNSGCMWHQLAVDPSAAPAALSEGKLRGRDRKPCLSGRHGREPLPALYGGWQIFVKVLSQSRFVVPHINLRRRAIHVQVQQPFGFGGKVGESGQSGVGGTARAYGLGGVLTHQP